MQVGCHYKLHHMPLSQVHLVPSLDLLAGKGAVCETLQWKRKAQHMIVGVWLLKKAIFICTAHSQALHKSSQAHKHTIKYTTHLQKRECHFRATHSGLWVTIQH